MSLLTLATRLEALDAERSELVGKMEVLIRGGSSANGHVAVAPTGKKRGRKPGSKNKVAAAPKAAKVKDGKRMKLKEVILEILDKNPAGLEIADVLRQVITSGYKSRGSKDGLSNTIYQTLYKMQNEAKTVTKGEDQLWKKVG